MISGKIIITLCILGFSYVNSSALTASSTRSNQVLEITARVWNGSNNSTTTQGLTFYKDFVQTITDTGATNFCVNFPGNNPAAVDTQGIIWQHSGDSLIVDTFPNVINNFCDNTKKVFNFNLYNGINCVQSNKITNGTFPTEQYAKFAPPQAPGTYTEIVYCRVYTNAVTSMISLILLLALIALIL